MPTSPTITWDLIKPSDIRNTRSGAQLTRGLMVKGLPAVIDARFGTDPGLLVRCMSVTGFPLIGEQFPYAPWSNLVVTEQRLLEVVNKTYSVKFAIEYEGFLQGLDPIWTVQEDYNVSFVQTQSTADDSVTLRAAYLPATAWGPYIVTSSDESVAQGASQKAGTVHKMKSGRVIRAIANMATATYNQQFRAAFRAAAGKINSGQWADMKRGTAYFVGPKTTTRNYGGITQVSCDFIVDPKGHYPLLAWRDRLGNHPKDSVTEQTIRSSGLPPVNTFRWANGLTIASVHGEADFSNTFSAFTDLIWSAGGGNPLQPPTGLPGS